MSRRGKRRIWTFVGGAVFFVGGALLSMGPQGNWNGDGAAPHPLPYDIGLAIFMVGLVLGFEAVVESIGAGIWRVVTIPRRRALRNRPQPPPYVPVQPWPSSPITPLAVMDEDERKAWQRQQGHQGQGQQGRK